MFSIGDKVQLPNADGLITGEMVSGTIAEIVSDVRGIVYVVYADFVRGGMISDSGSFMAQVLHTNYEVVPAKSFSKFDAFDAVKAGGDKYVLTNQLRWEVGKKGSGWFLLMPKGRVFDISVPWWMHWLVSPHDQALLPAAAIHDELLTLGFDTAFCSAEFKRAAIARKKKGLRAWLYFAVTLVWTELITRRG